MSLQRQLLVLAASAALWQGGCDVPSVIGPTELGDTGDAASVALDLTIVEVRFINDSAAALDVQFYASAEPIGEDPGTTLFSAANQIATGIGFAGTGLLPKQSSDELILDCDAAVAIGTPGGRFVSAETGEEVGTGQQRVAALDLQYVCGETITFLYRYDPLAGTYDTTLLVE